MSRLLQWNAIAGGAGRADSTPETSFALPKGQESQLQFAAPVCRYHFKNEIPCATRNIVMDQARKFPFSTMDVSKPGP